jgi:hypothetical protein
MQLSGNRRVVISLNQKAEREIGCHYSLTREPPPVLLVRSAALPGALKILTRQVEGHRFERFCVKRA